MKIVRKQIFITLLVIIFGCEEHIRSYPLPFYDSDFQEKDMHYVLLNKDKSIWASFFFRGASLRIHFYTKEEFPFPIDSWKVENGELFFLSNNTPTMSFVLIENNETERYFLVDQRISYQVVRGMLFYGQDDGWMQSFLYFVGKKNDDFLSKGGGPNDIIRIRSYDL